MQTSFSLPQGALGRFAIVKLWPEIKTAEDECIARITIAARRLGIDCVEINPDGGLRSDPGTRVDRDNVDFVIHLHYDTPKNYDAFSFVALWNPLAFYQQWGYARCSRNLTSHDDFLSCSSDAADDHVNRMIRGQATHLPPAFRLYHSTPGIAHPPSLGAHKLFYAGINWEALGGGRSRHQDVLKRLDKTGLLRICGPQLFQGVRVWQGYDSYAGEVPFDGVSMIDAIAEAGIALVLSSQAHKDAGLMSNRLFESVAAGALVICDENPFAKKFFGDALLYIDGRSSVERICADIVRHLDWARDNPDAALGMIARAQRILSERFDLTGNVVDLYNGLAARKRHLAERRNPPQAARPRIRLNLLVPEFSAAVLRAHVRSVAAQDYRDFSPVLVMDAADAADHRGEIEAAVAASPVPIELRAVEFRSPSPDPQVRAVRRLGAVVQELVDAARDADALVIVAPNETLLSNHLAVLAGALQRDPAVHCAATAAILLDGDAPVHGVHERIDFGGLDPLGPPGYGRFIVRTAAMAPDIAIALPYLETRAMAALVGDHAIVQQLPATVTIDVRAGFRMSSAGEAAEHEVIRDFAPQALAVAPGFVARSPQAVPVARIGLRELAGLLTSRRWLTRQVEQIREHGLAARVRLLAGKLTRR